MDRRWYEENRERVASYSKHYYQQNRDLLTEQAKAWRKANPERVKASIKRHRQRHPEKVAARSKLNFALFHGHISKPDHCADCGELTTSRNLHGHHHDYDKPLEVEWLCKDCHIRRHHAE